MNKAKFTRATFVLARETSAQLDYISERMRVSRSELVRDVIAEPVALMAKWVKATPDAPTEEDAQAVFSTVQLDLEEFIGRKAAEIEQ